MEEEKKEIGIGKFIVPIVAVAIFTLVLFGAGYAYFAATVGAENVTNISAEIPASTTSISTTSNTCTIQVLASEMAEAKNSNTTAINTTACYLNVSLNGAAGVKCSYDIILEETSATNYVPTTGVGTTDIPFEFTGTFVPTLSDSTGNNAVTFSKTTSSASQTIQNNETQLNTLVGTLYQDATTSAAGLIAKGVIEVETADTEVTHEIVLTEKWYNIPAPQATHASKVYSYVLKADHIVC